jgi:hypothetical protein
LSIVRVGNLSGGGRKKPGAATSGNRTSALKPPLHDVSPVAVGHDLQAAAVSLAAQNHTGSTVIIIKLWYQRDTLTGCGTTYYCRGHTVLSEAADRLVRGLKRRSSLDAALRGNCDRV